MHILFDQGTPVPLRGALAGHTVETAYERGWSTLGNGDLLTAAEASTFDVLITTPTSFNKLADDLEADAFREQHTRA